MQDELKFNLSYGGYRFGSADLFLTLADTPNADESFSVTALSGKISDYVGPQEPGVTKNVIRLADLGTSEGDFGYANGGQFDDYNNNHIFLSGKPTQFGIGFTVANDTGGTESLNYYLSGSNQAIEVREGVSRDVSDVTFTPVPTDPGSVVCFAAGTLILTVKGQVTVDALDVGDLVVTASGQHRPIRWLGHRSYAARFANTNPDLLPICIKANAIADGVPSRDLWVSPKHALYFDGVLVPAAALVNGANVVRAERVDSLTYWHVELDTHDVLLAENTPAESFVDDEGRGIFHNAQTFHDLYPDAVEAEAVYCAPRVEDGYALEAIRRRLAARAGLLGRAAAA